MKQNCIHKQSKIRNSVATSYQQADVEPFVEKQEFITRDEKMTVPVKSKCPPTFSFFLPAFIADSVMWFGRFLWLVRIHCLSHIFYETLTHSQLPHWQDSMTDTDLTV